MDEIVRSGNEISPQDPASVADRILIVRRHKVLLDSDLAEIYGVETKVLNQAVKRNLARFPADFLFQLTIQETREVEGLRSQNVTLKPGTSKRGHHRKYATYAFTEHGAVMLATILRSQTAIEASIQVVRAFVSLRSILSEQRELAKKIEKLEQKYDERFKVVFSAIKQLMSPIVNQPKKIGFIVKKTPKKK
jgi:phage regulator Rha-like protein